MATYTNIATGQVLSQEDFSALVCNEIYTCCDQQDNVWFTANDAKNEYQWQQYFIANNLCSDGNAPVNTVAPAISGTLVVGETLTCSSGTWTSDTGIIPPYTYQWYRGATTIGTGGNTYTLVQADAGKNIKCVVTACDSDGCTNADSNVVYIFDADYYAIIARGTSLGYTLPDSAQQVKQNTLLLSFKNDNVWAEMDVFYVFANNGSKEFGTLNWKNPSVHQCTLVNSPTWASNGGFTGNGTSSYIDTNFNPLTHGVKYTLNNASFFSWNNTYTINSFLSGVSTGSFNCMRMSSSSGNQRINMGNSGLFSPSIDLDLLANKWRKISRTNSTTGVASKNTTQTTHAGNSVAIESSNQLILRSGTSYSDTQVALFGMGASLVSENTNQYNAVNTYLTSI